MWFHSLPIHHKCAVTGVCELIFVFLVCVRSGRRQREGEHFILKMQSDRSYICAGGERRPIMLRVVVRGTTIDFTSAYGCVFNVPWEQGPLEAGGCRFLSSGKQLQLKESVQMYSPRRSSTKWQDGRAPSWRSPLATAMMHHRDFHELQTSSFLLKQPDHACGLLRFWIGKLACEP